MCILTHNDVGSILYNSRKNCFYMGKGAYALAMGVFYNLPCFPQFKMGRPNVISEAYDGVYAFSRSKERLSLAWNP